MMQGRLPVDVTQLRCYDGSADDGVTRTHHLVPHMLAGSKRFQVEMRCRYCGETEKELREQQKER